MENKRSSLLTPALIYSGIIIGVIIVHSIVIDILELNFSTYNQVAGFVLPLIGIALAIYGFRKEYNNNAISYQRALGFGVLVAFMVGLVLAVFSFIYTHYINPDLLEMGMQMAEEKMIQRGMSEEAIERAMQMQERFRTPALMIIAGTLYTTVIGAIFSLIAAAIIKKEPEHPFTDTEE